MKLDERRATSRIEHLFEVHLEGLQTHGVNLGANGALILTDAELPETEVRMVLVVEPGFELELSGRPVWQKRLTQSGRHAVGISFSVGQAETRRLIADWIERSTAA